MALGNYTQGQIFIEGALCAEEVTFSTSFKTNNQDVITQAKGFAGVTPGAGMTDVTIEEAIPRAGFELDFYKWAKNRTAIEIVGWRGSKKLTIKGFIDGIDEKHGVNTNSIASITIKGGEPDES